jgi:hypothetical protein
MHGTIKSRGELVSIKLSSWLFWEGTDMTP